MRAALKGLQALPVERRIAVLGVMAELGEGGDDEHHQIAKECAESGVQVIVVDAVSYGDNAEHVSDVAGVEPVLEDLLGSGPSETGILVKGSRVAELERVAGWIQQSQFFVELS
jgi:UDP-N-acetylmuramoyl-tripeptide--D-alanyl-D-alanine ligase